MADKTIDLKGLQCPMPILKTKKALTALAAGQTLEVLATDPGAPEDFQVFCKKSGNALIETSEADGVFRFVIQRGNA